MYMKVHEGVREKDSVYICESVCGGGGGGTKIQTCNFFFCF
jgi:hypothetical protein